MGGSRKPEPGSYVGPDLGLGGPGRQLGEVEMDTVAGTCLRVPTAKTSATPGPAGLRSTECKAKLIVASGGSGF